MEYKNMKKKINHNGINSGYNYPMNYYPMDDDYGRKDMPKVEGSFWTPCSKKEKGRHSFCDEE